MTEVFTAPREAAVIDIGSNSVRMVLYRLEGRAIWTVFNEKVLAGLGRDLSTTGRLSEPGVELAMTALRRFAAVLEGVRPAYTFVAATAAVREATDGPDFCGRVAAETGLQVRVLTGEEEAHYSALGVMAGDPRAHGLAADMGGSSLELIRIGNGRIEPGVTLALGPFALADPGGFDAARLRATISDRLSPVRAQFSADELHAVGGGWRSLAQLHMEMSGYPLRIVHQYAMSAEDARGVARFVAQQSKASLDRLPGVSKRRAETLPYAALVLEGLLDTLSLKRVIFSAWGLREGLLYETLDRDEPAADPLIAGCAALGARQGISPALPAALNAWLSDVIAALPEAFGPERDPVLAAAACRLADLGARLHPDHRLELVFDQVLRAPIPGQTHPERVWLACALNARYGGNAATPAPEAADRLLSDEARKSARALGLAMRLGCDLSGRSPQLLANASITVTRGQLKLTASDGYADVLLGEQTRRRAKALAEAMGLKLDI
ncbi:Ppx/GppA phosphatase family protein [Brevundimonas subvibrioides]|uniref:Ppx/GppA phosphatase n=1 Tax=Brevundimonas subvibrioides (strain ATCC 15264 / DSM 4735 / LMG 14903 / NBRC 16000 / CB 81) TaxID=633149 RepID=D9QJG2_BRESC|nr:Ppx/GppA phosphatase family protein [Brevundimonas subvibrioides]ADL01523.1 Ppx/GppA phosphatase [Brevundimonas subvibrioides ATCC 15264]